MLATIVLVASCLYLIGLRADRVQSARMRAVSEAGLLASGHAAGAPEGLAPVSLSASTESELIRVKAKLRQMRRLAYVRGRRVKQLKRVLMARPSVAEAIELACVTYRVSCSVMWQLARCESGLNPKAFNPSSSSGLLQILVPSTWRTTPYGAFDPFSAYANAMAGAYMLAQGRRPEWVC